MKRTNLFRRTVAAALVVALEFAGPAQAADLSAQMASMFGGGTLSNATGPGVYNSQTQRIYMGGEMELRFPTRNYQLYSYSLPSLHADCGGVDVYLGNFSHINRTEFRHMLEQVARMYAAMLFKAALKSINPMIESVIGDIQKTLEHFSAANANTCALARMAADATMDSLTSRNNCVTSAMTQDGIDQSEAEQRCRSDTTATNASAKASADPNIQALASRDLNLVIAALEKSSFSRAEKEVFMNIAGTIIMYKPENNGDVPLTPQTLDGSIDSLNTLLNGNAPAATPDQVTIRNWWTCDSDDCLAPTKGDVAITPFTTLVRRTLESIRDRVIRREPLSASEIAFVNMTSVPVYRLVALGSAWDADAGGAQLVDVLINRYAKVIAYDYAYAFMRANLKDLRLYIGMARLRDTAELQHAKAMIARVESLMEDIEREHGKATARIRDLRAVIDDLQGIERGLQVSMPASIRSMQAFSNLMRGRTGG